MKKIIMETKNFFVLVIAVVMCISMLTVTAVATDGDEYDLWVGNIRVNAANADDVLGDGTVSYNAEENILTLNGANITEGYNSFDYITNGIYAMGDLNIKLADGTENKIATPGNEESFGIFIEGALCISGDGNLTVIAGSYNGENAESIGIYTTYGLSIEEANVAAFGGDVTASDLMAESAGVSAYGDINIDFDGSLIAVGGNASGYLAYSAGIDVYGEDENYYNVSVYDGYLEARGGNVTGVEHATSFGLYLDYTGLYVYESSAIVIAKSGDSTVTSVDKNIVPQALSAGIYVYGGDVEINAGNITSSAGVSKGLEAFSYGILAEPHKYDDGSFGGGYVNIYCNEVTPSQYSPGFVGTTVKASAPGGVAIYSETGIEIEDILTINEPENATIGEAEDGFGILGWAVLNADSTFAENVTIKPLTYQVNVSGLNYAMMAQVPVGKSLNETYCEMYGIDDFSEVFDTEKEGYTFGGFYTDEACTDGNEFDFDTSITEDITIYAKWIKVEEIPPVDNEQVENEQDGTESDKNDNQDNDKEDNKQPVEDPELPNTDANSYEWFAMASLSALSLVAYITISKKKKFAKR